MKKLFLLIPALVLSLVLNAAVINITPTSPYDSHDNLRLALYYANAGDEIVLADGTYDEHDDYLYFNKDITVRAAEGAHPVIDLYTYAQIKSDANVTIDGLKFNGAAQGSYSYYIRFYDASHTSLHLNNCEFYSVKNYVLFGNSASHTDECNVNNCYFHNNVKNAVYFEASATEGVQTCDKLVFTNSTVVNTDALTNWTSIIDVRPYGSNMTDAIKVIIDHCTFYNNPTVDSGHADIRLYKLSDATVSNCIFAHPEEYARRATYNYGGTISNCLTYNLTYDASRNAHRQEGGNPVLTNNFTADPLFTDAANGDFSFAGNWVTPSISPARGAATDGSDLGDPRWYSAEVLPEVDFSSPYQLVGAKAQITGNLWYNSDDAYLYFNNKSQNGTAKWKIHAERACVVGVELNMHEGSPTVHKIRIDVLDAEGNSVGEFAEQASTLPGTLIIPAEGDYTIILNDDQEWTSAQIDNITLSYIGGDVQSMPGTTDIDDAWFSSKGTRTAGEKIVIPSGYQHEGWVKWNVSFANTANYKAKVNINCDNGHNYTVALYEDENDLTPITWGEGGQTENESPLDLGAKEVPAGNYILKVTNAVQYSHAELVSVQFVNAGGGLVNIPGNITLTEAILSSRAYIDENGEIRFTDDAHAGHVTEESAAWRVNVSKAGNYKFTTSVNSVNGHSYLVSIYNADETVLKGSVTQSGDDIWGAPKTFSTDNIYLEAGEYRVKVQNTTPNSKGRIVSISASYEGGALVNLPINAIPFEDAILNGATRDNDGIHFGAVDRYAEWNVAAAAGLYTFTFDVVGTNYGHYQLTILDGENIIYDDYKGKQASGSVTHSSIYLDGNYTLRVANTNSGADGYITSISATAEENVFVMDENTTDDGSIAAADGNTYKFLLKRSFTAGKYYTICLPVSSWNDELKLAFGEDYELWAMSSATQAGDEINLNFTQINGESFHAGMPYLIKPSINVENPIFYNEKTIHNYTYNNVQSFDAADFVGSFYKTVIPAGESNLYLQNNELFYNANNDTPIKGTRAWIRLKQQSGNQAPARARIVLQNQVATSIDLVKDANNGTIKTIENGQLVIIRDGIKYNVMGARLQ